MAKKQLILVVLLLCCGCGFGSDSNLSTTTGQYQSLQFTASARAVYRQAAPVTVTLSVTNVGSQPVTYTYPGCEEYIGIVRQEGQDVATFPGCSGCGGGLGRGVFAPGETRTFTMTWNQKWGKECGLPQEAVAPGQYSIQAWLAMYDINGDTSLFSNPVGPPPLAIHIQ